MLPYHTFIGDSAEHWMLVLHGIYGSGGNWRTFARKLNERRPEWGFALVDLRMHGRSQELAPPHTVSAAAGDLVELADHMANEGRPVRSIAGHSFGGKVALGYVGARGHGLERAVGFDSSPDSRAGAMDEEGNTVVDVLRLIEQLPERFDDRAAFIQRLCDFGHPAMLANWLAMNLEPAGDGVRFRLDPSAMRALLADYYGRDCWSVVEIPPCPIHFIAAGRGSSLHEPARSRVADLVGDRISLDVVEDAGHWLHVDALDELLALVDARLGS